MYSKSNIRNEEYYWKKQIERHRIGKRIRKLARKINDREYKKLAMLLGEKSKTVWARANGLAVSTRKSLEMLDSLENDFRNRVKELEDKLNVKKI